jgi:hypothetical protein
MRFSKIRILAAVVVGACIFPLQALAHQPRLVQGDMVQVPDPEVSKAYYDELTGAPRTYRIDSPSDFNLYLNLLVPKNTNPNARYSALVYRAEPSELIAKLDGQVAPWKELFEEFGRDYYYQGPELRTRLPPGSYLVLVQGNGNYGKYVLAAGETESFPPAEIWNAMTLVPKLKSNFFSSSPAGFILSPFGAVYAALLLAIGFAAGFFLRAILKRRKKQALKITKRNIGLKDRLWRLSIAVLFFIIGLYTWNPLAFLAAGFVLYETVASWCALYAYLGKNTCPMP